MAQGGFPPVFRAYFPYSTPNPATNFTVAIPFVFIPPHLPDDEPAGQEFRRAFFMDGVQASVFFLIH
jgi:hypothetical protein